MNRKQRKSAVSDKHTKNTEKACKEETDSIKHEQKSLDKAITKPWYLNES